VTESSTISGTATAASTSSVSSGNTEEHDGTDSSAQTIVEESDEQNDASGDSETSSETESKSSNTLLIVGSSVGVIAIAAVVGFLVMRGRATGIESKDFSQQLWNQEPAVAQAVQPINTQQMGAIPMQSQPVQQAPVVQQPVAPAVAPAPPQAMATAPPPPAQPDRVADYTGLPPGGQYDQSTGQTIYIGPDQSRWQMMPDGSFNRIG
jgi:hypothetical protein